MNKFGFKIVDDHKNMQDYEQMLFFAKQNGLPLEIGFYKDHSHTIDELLGEWRPAKLNIHTNHYKFAVCDYFEGKNPSYLQSLEVCLGHGSRLGSKYAIVHLYRYQLPKRYPQQKEIVGKITEAFRFFTDVAAKYGSELYVENTFEDIDFFEMLFASLKDAGIRGVHFCHDIGHAKVWSNSSSDAWEEFLQKLLSEKVKAHFHIHANRGLFDEHLPFNHADNTINNDSYYKEESYTLFARRLGEKFPECPFIAEVHPQVALENFQAVYG